MYTTNFTEIGIISIFYYKPVSYTEGICMVQKLSSFIFKNAELN